MKNNEQKYYCIDENFIINEIEKSIVQDLKFILQKYPQSTSIAMAALSKSVSILPYIKDHTEELQLFASKLSYGAIRHIKNPTEKVCRASVSKSGYGLQFIKNQTEELCMIAIENDPLSMKFVQNQTVDLCLKLLELNSNLYYLVNIVENKTYEMTFDNLMFLKNKKTLIQKISDLN